MQRIQRIHAQRIYAPAAPRPRFPRFPWYMNVEEARSGWAACICGDFAVRENGGV
jgi:hypothetical protein